MQIPVDGPAPEFAGDAGAAQRNHQAGQAQPGSEWSPTAWPDCRLEIVRFSELASDLSAQSPLPDFHQVELNLPTNLAWVGLLWPRAAGTGRGRMQKSP